MARSSQPFFLHRDLTTAMCRLKETDGRTSNTLVGRGQHRGADLSARLPSTLRGCIIKVINSCCIDLSFQIGLDTSYWTAVNQFFIWGSLSVYFAIIFTMYSDGMYLIFTASFPFIGKHWDSSCQGLRLTGGTCHTARWEYGWYVLRKCPTEDLIYHRQVFTPCCRTWPLSLVPTHVHTRPFAHSLAHSVHASVPVCMSTPYSQVHAARLGKRSSR